MGQSVGSGPSQVTVGGRLVTYYIVGCRNDAGDHSDHYYQVGFRGWEGGSVGVLR